MPTSGSDHQEPIKTSLAQYQHREGTGTGRFASSNGESESAPDRVPEWVQPKPGETEQAWRDRIWSEFFAYQLSQGFMHDLVALKRHELAAKHLWPIKQEIDLTARREDWLQYLTDEQLLVLKQLRDLAMLQGQQQALPAPPTDSHT